ncbi:MAG TPA: hypothetical protein VHM31_14795, partial [Polyangia bacterium]|nr:hypothetical protein [Polyangia bacterium]
MVDWTSRLSNDARAALNEAAATNPSTALNANNASFGRALSARLTKVAKEAVHGSQFVHRPTISGVAPRVFHPRPAAPAAQARRASRSA